MVATPSLRSVGGSDASAGNDTERRLLQAFRKLEPGKREAVLKLLD